jgi:MOSC domain-containing protein YiiM
MSATPSILSIQVGQIASYPVPGQAGQFYPSAIVKEPVSGPVWLGLEGLSGDSQADRKNHGGPSRAANVYPGEHYPFWRQTPGLARMSSGAFGENFTTSGLLEDTVFIGDTYRLGDEVLVTVSQPRGPCYKLNRRWNVPDLDQRAIKNGFVGWYFSVRQEGFVAPGSPVELAERPNPDWSVTRVWSLFLEPDDPAALRKLVGIEGLSEGWRDYFQSKIA